MAKPKKTNTRTAPITPAEASEAVLAYEAHGSTRKAAAGLEITRSALMRRLRKADQWGITPHGEIVASQSHALAVPENGVARYILTAAQSNTSIHPELWENIKALATHYGAEIMVGRIRYNHTAQQIGQEATGKGSVDDALWYDAALEPYFCQERVEIAPGLLWVGDMNIIPTATSPLSGLDSFAGATSCIFAHPQIAQKSVATAPDIDAKMLYTTGAVTLKRYIKRKAGQKAEFHHAYAALIAEVDAAGDWFVRQLNADTTGTIHDLDLRVAGGVVGPGTVEVLTPGDIHGTEIDPVAHATVWGTGGMVDVLKPAVQVAHDVLNFGRRSHHNTVFDLIAAHYNRAESVEGEIEATAAILGTLLRPWMKTYVVKANHDEHFDRWITEADFRRDPVNASFYLEAAGQKVAALKRQDRDFDLVEWALKKAGLSDDVTFLARDERLEIAGIRHDQHGDLGPNGARGSAANISRTGEKTNIGHSHSAGIVHGCYQMGTMSVLRMGYTRGPSSWSHTLTLTYGNRKRANITLKNGKWRAQ